MTSPPPCLLKLIDFAGDESVCFDRDLEVLIWGRLRVIAKSVLGVGGEVIRRPYFKRATLERSPVQDDIHLVKPLSVVLGADFSCVA